MNDGFAKRDGPLELFYPRNANAVAIFTSGDAWAWTAYSTVQAATSEGFVPHELNLAIQVYGKVATAMAVWIEYELATGAADSEVNFFRYTDVVANYTMFPGEDTANLLAFGRTLPVGPKEIPAGTRLSQRIRISAAYADMEIRVWAYLGGYAGGGIPLTYTPYVLRPYLAGVNRAKSDISVAGDSYALMKPTAFPNYGTWVQVIDPAPSDLIIYGLAQRQDSLTAGAGSFYVQIGTGAAGSEVPRRVMGIPRATSYQGVGMFKMRYPVFVKKGERVAIRGTGYTVNFRVKLLWEAA